MNAIVIKLILGILGRILTPELIAKYEAQLMAFLQAELSNAPALLHELEKHVVFKLAAIEGESKIEREVLAIVAKALSVELPPAPEPAPAAEPA